MNKLAIYNTSLSRGGAERITVYLADYMVKHGVACDIITERIEKHEYDAPAGVERKCLTAGKPFLLKLCELRKVIKETEADVLLIMGVPNCVYATIASLGLKTKVVVSERNDPKNFLGKKIVKYISRILMNFADGFVFQTHDAKAFYERKLKGRGTVIFNPLFAEGLPEAYTGERKKHIVTAGRLHSQKNQMMLISAFSKVLKQYSDYKLMIYGEGSLRAELEAQVTELGLTEKVLLPGNLSDLHNHIKDAAMFVLPSDFEGMPNALIEAMAIGLPCISTDCPCGGPRELIENDKNGVLVPVGDVMQLSKSMERLIEDQTLANHIGENAVEIRKMLDSEVIGRQWMTYLSGV